MKLGRVKNLLWNVSNLRCLYCAHCGISCEKKKKMTHQCYDIITISEYKFGMLTGQKR